MLAWKRGIAILTAGNVKVSPDPRVHLSNGYTLQIKDAREQDAGDYICQIATIDPREITHHVEILGSFRRISRNPLPPPHNRRSSPSPATPIEVPLPWMIVVMCVM